MVLAALALAVLSGLALVQEAILKAPAPDNPRWKQELAGSLSWLGEAVYRLGRIDDALRRYEETAALLGSLTVSRPDNTDWRTGRRIVAARHRAEGFLIEADALEATSGSRGVQDALTRALASIAPAAEGSTRADLLWTRARALVRLGRRAEARAILQALAAQSFRPLEYTRFCARHSCEGEQP